MEETIIQRFVAVAETDPVEWARERWTEVRPVAESLFLRLIEEEDGVALAEYVMIVFMIAVISVVAMRFMATMAGDTMSGVGNMIEPQGANISK